jgi:S-adenosylmethionine uptake transporter
VPASLLMVAATFLFATMAVCVKLASALYDPGEIVMYRGSVGVLMMGVLCLVRGQTLRTKVPAMHFWRSLSGVCALSLWFYAIGKLPLATAITLNYMSSIWMALFLIGGAVMLGSARIDWRLIASVLLGFAGVALVLRPTLDQQQLWHGLAGLLSGMLSAMAYLQVTALGRAGEPEDRVVFYFSVGGVAAGLLSTTFMAIAGGAHPHGHTLKGAALLLAVGLLATTAQLLMTRAYGRGTPLVNACLQYLGIVFSVIYGALLFRDPITPMALGGIALIITAGLAATLLRANVTPKDSQHSINES